MKHFFTLLALASLCSCSGEPRASVRPNVVLACIDTLRSDHLGLYGYRLRPTSPHLDRLAGEATVFEDASATAGWTKPSVPSFLTGRYPLQHGVYEGSTLSIDGQTSDVLSDQATTLAEVFSAGGWRTGAFVKNAQLDRGNGFEQGFESYRDKAGDAREIRWQALDWIDADPTGQPFFLYLHFLDAHWPYAIPDEAAERFAAPDEVAAFREQDWKGLRDAINDGQHVPSAAELELVQSLYDAGIRHVDDQLGALFAGLEQRGLWEDTIVCVISDHGEEFMEHGRIGHGHGLYEHLLQVPWILRVPGRLGEPAGRRRRLASAVSLVDVFPTLAGVVGLPVPEEVVGVDRWSTPDVEAPILAEHKEPGAYQQSLRSGREKLVRRFEPLGGGRADPEPAPGGRWEAELRDAPEGRLLARSMKLRDEPPLDPFEVKGPITDLRPGGFMLCGFEVRCGADTELYGSVPEGVDSTHLTDGLPVKVKGSWDGLALQAERIKVYDPAERYDLELRGRLEELEGTFPFGRARLGPVWIELDADTRWDTSLLDEQGSRLTRAELAALVLAPEERAGFEVTRRCYDLAADPGEQRPRQEGCAALDAALDELGRELSATAGHGGTRALEESALAELRVLGYLR